MKTMIKLIATLALLSAACFGQQYTLGTTTLGAAITTANATTITITSTSTWLNRSDANRIDTCFYVDTELFGVITVVDSTHVVVQQRGRGCGAIGLSSRPTTHASGAKVYFAITQTIGSTIIPAASLIGKNDSPTAENFGSCTVTNELALPKLYIFTGDVMNCFRTGAAGTSGQWVKVGMGSMAPAGTRYSNFCTGTTGSGETEYLNGAACSGATTETARILVTTPATLANFYVAGSANVVSMGSDAVTVRVNGSDTAVTCTIASATKTCSDTVHSVNVVPGDYITFKVVSTASDTLANVGASVGAY